jgi:hypothetical protein
MPRSGRHRGTGPGSRHDPKVEDQIVNVRIPALSLGAIARIAGVLYLIIIVTAGFAEVMREQLVVVGDAAATAANILASEGLYRLSFAADMVAFPTDVALALVLYLLLRPVSEGLALLAAFFRLAEAAILGLNMLMQFIPLLLLHGGETLTGFDGAQVDDLAYLFLEAHGYGYLIGLVFFAMSNVVLGYLVIKSGYLPKLLGFLLMVVVPLGYLVDSFATFLWPAYPAQVSQLIVIPVGLAEVAFAVWLLVKGVTGQQPDEQRQTLARAADAPAD